MRVFFAIFPPPEVQKEALGVARRLLLDDRIRWIRPENIHLTLKFMGNVGEEILEDLCSALEETCTRHGPFGARLSGLGAFPSARRARILWAGVGTGSERLRSLATDLEATLVPLGFESEERPYAPHLTLGRVRGRPASIELPKNVGDLGRFRVQRVELTESTLTERGSMYKTIESFVLNEELARP